MDNQNEKVVYWLELSEYDLRTADAMLETGRYLYVGFMCHQVVEKALKAYHAAHKELQPPYTHNLSRLATLSGLYESFTETQKDLLDTLEPLNIEARYPTHKQTLQQSLNHERCANLIRQTKEFFAWIQSKL